MISICSLIYRSTRYADAVWNSAHKHTEELRNGSARFFFVANDASQVVISHLSAMKYPFVDQRNEHLSERALRRAGYVPPEYIRRVYQGWNRAIQESNETMVLVNSDCMFSPGWLTALSSWFSPSKAISSKLIEREHPKHGRFLMALRGEFGAHPDHFDEAGFLISAERHRKHSTSVGGAFMPVMLSRTKALEAGMYPEGNTETEYGDRAFFARLARVGVSHLTANDSIVYHFKEGEMDE